MSLKNSLIQREHDYNYAIGAYLTKKDLEESTNLIDQALGTLAMENLFLKKVSKVPLTIYHIYTQDKHYSKVYKENYYLNYFSGTTSFISYAPRKMSYIFNFMSVKGKFSNTDLDLYGSNYYTDWYLLKKEWALVLKKLQEVRYKQKKKLKKEIKK